MSASKVLYVADALGRDLALAIERSCLYARMLEGASRRARRAAESADPARKQSVAAMTDQIRRAVTELSSALASLLEESGRLEALIRTRSILARADDVKR